MTDYPLITDLDRKIFIEEFKEKLPQKIFDSHVHIIKKSSFPPGFSLGEKSFLKRFNDEFILADAVKSYREILPGTEVSLVGFGFPDPHTDRSDAADFGVDNEHVFGLRLLSPSDSLEEIDRDLRKFHLAGLKPYPDLVPQIPGRQVSLKDFFSEEQLKYMDRSGLVTTIHIPGKDRLNDPQTRKLMVEFCREYPNANFIFAHIGRAYFMRGITGLLDELAECPNAWLDTAMVNHRDVLKYTFDHFPAERILFGSDAPISLLHGKSVEINHQYAYVTSEKIQLGNVIHDVNGTVVYTLFLYEQLRSILDCGLTSEYLKDFFFNNAYRLFSSTTERIYKK